MSLLFRNWPQAARSSNTILFVVLIRKSKIYSWILRTGQRGFYGTPFAPESLFLCPVVLKKKVKNSMAAKMGIPDISRMVERKDSYS